MTYSFTDIVDDRGTKRRIRFVGKWHEPEPSGFSVSCISLDGVVIWPIKQEIKDKSEPKETWKEEYWDLDV